MTRIVLFLLLGWKVLMNFLIGWFLDTLCVPLYVPFMCIFFLPSERERFWQTKWTRCWLCRAGYWLLVSKVECTVLKKTYLNSFHIHGQFARSSWDFHIVAITLCGGFFLYVSYSCFFKWCIKLSETLTVDMNFIYLSGEQRDQAWHWWAFFVFLRHIVSPLS